MLQVPKGDGTCHLLNPALNIILSMELSQSSDKGFKALI